MKYAFIHAHRQEFSLRLMCRVLEVARSGYYAFERCPKGARQLDNERLLEQVKQIHEASGKTYGSPRVHGQLMAQGEGCSRGRVARLMARAGIRVVSKRRFVVTTASAHTLPVAPNLLEQQFEVLAPGRVWVSDITYIPVVEGWLYLAVVMDLCSRRVLGWSMGERLGRRLVLHAVDMARLRQCPAPGLIVHTDRGSQYASRDYRHLLSRYGMRASMSRKGNCWDNAPMESFFATLKKELVHRRRYRTRAEARADIFAYIEMFYNQRRLHSRLGYISPADFERQSAAHMAA